MFIKEYGKVKAHILRQLGFEPFYNVQPAENGEYAFLRHVRGLPEVAGYNCIVDVGAHIGDWTFEAAESFRDTNIDSFLCVEPIPTLARKIRERYASNPKIRLFETALSDEGAGEAEIFDIGGGGRMYRSYRGNSDRHAKKGTKTIVPHTVARTTGDELFGSLQYRPYLIKIDCDGHDYHVLRGFAAVMKNARPLIQFEYCDFWIGGRSRLRDACRLLHEVGYNTYKLLPHRLVKFRYNTLFETFGYQNIVAVPKEFPSFSERAIDLAVTG